MKGLHAQRLFRWFLGPTQQQFIKNLGTNEQRPLTFLTVVVLQFGCLQQEHDLQFLCVL